MAFYNLTQNISLNTLQNNIFLNGMPVCESILQKGINYTFSYDTSVDRCIWATYNKTDTDLIKTVPGDRKISLLSTENVTNENCIFVRYSPHHICNFTDILTTYGLVCDVATEELLNRIELKDYATGKTIRGLNSNAEATITGFSKSCNDIICLEYDRLSGVFENGEPLEVLSIGNTVTVDFHQTIENFNGDATQLTFADTISTFPFINGSSQDYTDGACDEFKKFVSYPFNTRIDFDSFSRKTRIDFGCSEETRDQITVQYTPSMLHLFDPNIICDWDDVAIQLLETFPYYDMLTGQTIRGWHSSSTAEVERASVQLKDGSRYIVLTLKNATGDFFAEEPLSIDTLTQREILDLWETEIATYNTIPNFYSQLRTFVNRPFFTSSTATNAICTGLLEDNVNEASQRVNISIDGCVLDKSMYEIKTMLMNDYLKTCEDRCVFFPNDFYVYCIQLTADVPIGKEIRIKTDTVPYAVNNGSMQNMSIDIPANSRDRTFYINDDTYSLQPLEICVQENSINSRAFTLDDIISENIACEYPMFKQFMEYHFSYSHSIGNGKHFLNNSYDLSSIDCIPKDVLPTLAKETLGPLFCEKELYKSRALQKEFVNFWNYNGTDQGIEYIFEIMCWPKPTIISPCNNVFTVSGDDFYCPEYLYAINSFHTITPHDNTLICDWDDILIDDAIIDLDTNILEEYVGYDLNGTLSNSTSVLESTKTFTDKNGQPITVAEISHRVGNYSIRERLEIEGSNKDITFTTDDILGLPAHIPDFITNIANFGISSILRGDILIGIDVLTQDGEFCLYEELEVLQGCQESRIYVDCIVNGSVRNIVVGEGCAPNHGFVNGETITLVKRNVYGNIIKTITGTAIVGNTFRESGFYTSSNSLTDDIVVLNDNCLTDPNAYVISVPMNRKEYIDIYNDTSREAGSYAFSEYPVTEEHNCFSRTIEDVFEVLPAL